MSQAVEHFWNLVKAGLVTTGAVGATTHPAMGLLYIGAEAINQVQAWTANRRSEEFAEDVADGLYEAHQEHKLTIEQVEHVINSEQFNSALLQARLIATRTHQKEKLEALRNAVLNVAATGSFSEDQQGIFMSLVDSLQPIHLYLLKELDKRTERVQLREVIQDLKRHARVINFDMEEIQSLLEDLSRANLIRLDSGVARLIFAVDEHCTTHLGHKFMEFISAPGAL